MPCLAARPTATFASTAATYLRTFSLSLSLSVFIPK